MKIRKVLKFGPIWIGVTNKALNENRFGNRWSFMVFPKRLKTDSAVAYAERDPSA